MIIRQKVGKAHGTLLCHLTKQTIEEGQNYMSILQKVGNESRETIVHKKVIMKVYQVEDKYDEELIDNFIEDVFKKHVKQNE